MHALEELSAPALHLNMAPAGQADASAIVDKLHREEAALFSAPLILIAVADADTQRFIGDALAPSYRLASASGDHDGIEMALALRPDVILLEVTPGAYAERTVHGLRARAELGNIPILVLTEKADTELRVNLLRAGAHDYLTKPFTWEELRVRVTNQIALKRAREVLQEELSSQSQDVAELANVVTFHKRALQTTLSSLRKQEETLRLILETLPVGVWVADKRGRITMQNPAGLAIFAGAHAPAPGRAVKAWLAHGGRSVEVQEWALARALREGVGALNEVIDVECLDGSVKTLLHSAVPIHDAEQRVAGAIMVSQDISAIKHAEAQIRQLNETLELRVAQRTAQLEEANKELEAFSYSVSHDLRAPLRHISGFADMLRTKIAAKTDGDGLRYLGIITESARKAGHLIDDLLSFSRMGRTELQHSLVDMQALAQEVQSDLSLDESEQAIVWRLGELPVVEGDVSMLRLVLQNLISNAMKYTRQCTEAHIEIGCATRENEYVFHVKDNGVGFDMKYVNKLFGVFQRLHSEADFEGTGIGLANVQRIITRHGGRTWAEGVPDEGATFFFSLPRAKK